jgi:hypothetical protein
MCNYYDNIFLATNGIGWQDVNVGLSPMLLGAANMLLAQANPTNDVNLLQGLFQAFILGIIQGLTEFLPISSTAHLEVFTKALQWETAGDFSIFGRTSPRFLQEDWRLSINKTGSERSGNSLSG